MTLPRSQVDLYRTVEAVVTVKLAAMPEAARSDPREMLANLRAILYSGDGPMTAVMLETDVLAIKEMSGALKATHDRIVALSERASNMDRRIEDVSRSIHAELHDGKAYGCPDCDRDQEGEMVKAIVSGVRSSLASALSDMVDGLEGQW